MNGKAPVARCRFALGAGQRIFFPGLGVQKHGEVAPHGQVAQRHQLFRRGADDDPVAVFHRQAQQGVPHRSTHHVNLHGLQFTGGLYEAFTGVV